MRDLKCRCHVGPVWLQGEPACMHEWGSRALEGVRYEDRLAGIGCASGGGRREDPLIVTIKSVCHRLADKATIEE